MKCDLKIITISLIFACVTLTGSAQLRRIMAHTTAQTLAMTDGSCVSQFSLEVIEAYDCESVDVPPIFPGGQNALVRYINSSRRYPADAYNRRVQGRVLCSFVVQPDGSVTHINVLRSVDPDLDREAVRVLSCMPNWQAGRIGDVTVPVYCIMPVQFRL
ncbi:MAG: energy transducer TonB [Bacteroides sp.]|nr:energy transducer TonB [Bacteroides sp.]